jgi:hypothetical protein
MSGRVPHSITFQTLPNLWSKRLAKTHVSAEILGA